MKASAFHVLLFSILTYLLLLLLFGYQFGDNDHIELLPYILKLQDPTLYQNDFFLDSMFAMIPNERHIFASVFSLFPASSLEWVFFIFHVFSSLILIFGLYRIAERFVSRPYLIWSAIILNLLFFHEWNFGKVEMYYSAFQASNLAKAIAVWSIFYFIDGHKWAAFILLIAVTYIQVVVGLNLAIVFTSIVVLGFRRQAFFSDLKPVIAYTVLTLPFLLLLLMNRSAASDKHYFEIMFNFRHQHHFFIYSSDKIILMLSLIMLSLVFYFNRSKELFLFTMIITIGTCIYVLNMQFLKIEFIANFNWLKNTIWLKYLGFVGFVGLLEKYLPKFTFKPALLTLFLGLAILTTGHLLLNQRDKTNYTAPLEFPTRERSDSSLDICEQIINRTNNNALFIQPFNFTALKYHSQRASYVDFKAIPRSPKFAQTWYKRINEVYGLSLTDGGGFGMKQKADKNYKTMSDKDIPFLSKHGITHLLTFRDHKLNAPVIAENSDYIVYKLTED
ncbi:MAG: hypothetical protein HKN22_08710 [Bacteroidia bacterium]|nr:hypothetical protein [Bacteroidia bacterium]